MRNRLPIGRPSRAQVKPLFLDRDRGSVLICWLKIVGNAGLIVWTSLLEIICGQLG
jgi:hypothetical protein